MGMATSYPIRQGLSLPRGENLQSSEVFCEGGIDVSQNIIELRPGFAQVLVNFEPGIRGGYRRINGYDKYDTNIVPGATDTKVIGVAVYVGGQVLAARQDASDPLFYNIYRSSGSNWTRINPIGQSFTGDTHTNTTIDGISINTNLLAVGQTISGTDIPANTKIASIVSATAITISAAATGTTNDLALTTTRPLSFNSNIILQSTQYNWTGDPRITLFDGINSAYRWDGTNFVILSATGSPANPKFGTMFNGYLFLSGYTSNEGAVTTSAPLEDDNYASVDGALEFVVGDEVMGLRSWRERLIIFCKNSIWNLTGSSTDPSASDPFRLKPITREVGCLEGRTIQECNGDLLFLSQDGIRPISGTMNIGDTEIGSISRPIQDLLVQINPITTPLHSIGIKKKNQYRLFNHAASDTRAESRGFIGSIRKFRNGDIGWEWGRLAGMKPACADGDYINTGEEVVVFGGYDGYVYQFEQGNSFDGFRIGERYLSVPLELGDYTLRKVLHRITTYGYTEGNEFDLFLDLRYDYLKQGVLNQSGPYRLSSSTEGTGDWDGAGIDWDDGTVWASTPFPVFRQSVQGSGFVVQLNYTTTEVTDSYVIQGFNIEFFPAGRR